MLSISEVIFIATITIWVGFVSLTITKVRYKKLSSTAVLKFLALVALLATCRIVLSLYLSRNMLGQSLSEIENYFNYLLFPEFPILGMLSLGDDTIFMSIAIALGSFIWLSPVLIYLSKQKNI